MERKFNCETWLSILKRVLSQDWPDESHEYYLDNLDKYKEIIDRSPYKFLQQHLDDAVRKEQYELAQHIRDRMEFLEMMGCGQKSQ